MCNIRVARVRFLDIIMCAPKNATDEQIEEAANRLSPCGTTNGWRGVIRNDPETPARNPVQCVDDPDYLHYIVQC